MKIQLLTMGLTEWLGIGSLIVAILALPISKWWKARRVPKKIRKLKEGELRMDEIRPNFQIYKSPNDCGGKMILVKNEGSKAFGIILSGLQTHIPYTLNMSKHEAERGEVISIFLGNNFHLIANEKMHIVIGYADIEGRRYQQSYSRTGNAADISSPQLLK